MDALKRLMAAAEAGDERAKRLADALDTLAALAEIDPQRRQQATSAARDAIAAALGLEETDCADCEGAGEIGHWDSRGPEHEWWEPCRTCRGYGWGYAERGDPHADRELVTPDRLRAVVAHEARMAAPPPPQPDEDHEDDLPF